MTGVPHRCCMLLSHGRHSTVKVLLEYGADINAEYPLDLSRPLAQAACGGYNVTVTVLLQMGAAIDHRNCNGKTALDMAQEEAKASTIQLLESWGRPIDDPERVLETSLNLRSELLFA